MFEKMTKEELNEECRLFLEAGKRYWNAAQKAGVGGAVMWAQDQQGWGCVFTRGEYREHMMHGIHQIGAPVVKFGAVTADE
jgi:hypothetical protein